MLVLESHGHWPRAGYSFLSYFFTAISIVCDRGEGHPLLRAGTTLSLRTKALLKRISQRTYILAYSVQLAFLVWLIRVSFYTHAMHRFLWHAYQHCILLDYGY